VARQRFSSEAAPQAAASSPAVCSPAPWPHGLAPPGGRISMNLVVARLAPERPTVDHATIHLRIAARDGRALLAMSALLNPERLASIMKCGSRILRGRQLAAQTRVRLARHRRREWEQSC
jgi:hypothetical protein